MKLFPICILLIVSIPWIIFPLKQLNNGSISTIEIFPITEFNRLAVTVSPASNIDSKLRAALGLYPDQSAIIPNITSLSDKFTLHLSDNNRII